MSFVDPKWVFENLLTEILFGLFLLPFIFWVGKILYERFIRARKIVYVLSLHNNPTRTWRKGVYAADRFMDIYEANVPLNSEKSLVHGGGDAGAAWWTRYIDEGILAKYALVTLFEEGGIKKVKVANSRLTRTVYRILKKRQDKEDRVAEQYRLNSKGYRDLPDARAQ